MMKNNLKINDVFRVANSKKLYVVTAVAMTGGGYGHGHHDYYPDRREITAAMISGADGELFVQQLGRKLKFYEGNKNVTKVGRANTKILVTSIALC